jgi:hypothetical protein
MPLRQLANECGDVGLRLQLRDQLPYLAMGHPTGPLEHSGRVVASQMRSEPRDPAQMQPAIGQHLEQRGILPRRPRDRDAQVGLVLPQMENPPAVLEHRRARLPRVKPPDLHFSDVGHDLGLDRSRLPHERGELTEKVVVWNALQAQHGDSLGEKAPQDVC